ncbi:MAG: hypothetical protein K2I22_02140 [Lachnospiraceae bacterium]|nr:hypothetical protein [Lachnospiraceae bacterium]
MKKKSVKQIVALTAVVLLVALYVVTLLLAVFDTSASGFLFRLSAICTVVIPLFAWIFIWIYGQATGKKTIADLNLMQDPPHKKKEGGSAEPVETGEAEE